MKEKKIVHILPIQKLRADFWNLYPIIFIVGLFKDLFSLKS